MGVTVSRRAHVGSSRDSTGEKRLSQGNRATQGEGEHHLLPGFGLPQGITAPGLRVNGDRKESISRMNRFFSKLNLQDIKINPEGNSFPPDADEQDGAHQQVAESVVTVEVEEEIRTYDVITGTEAAVDLRETSLETSSVSVEAVTSPDGQLQTAPSNGHGSHEVSATVEYIAEGEVVRIAGEVLKVSARSRPSAVAGAIAGVVRESGRAEVQAIGAGATNQAVKAVAIARDYLAETGIDAVCVPAFIDVTIENEDRTAIRLVVEPR